MAKLFLQSAKIFFLAVKLNYVGVPKGVNRFFRLIKAEVLQVLFHQLLEPAKAKKNKEPLSSAFLSPRSGCSEV